MNFTKDVPTVPGDYRWKAEGRESERLVSVFKSCPKLLAQEAGACEFFLIDAMGGEWCRLVPADEVEKAWDEAREWSAGHNFGQWHFDTDWNNSRAKRVMEGRE